MTTSAVRELAYLKRFYGKIYSINTIFFFFFWHFFLSLSCYTIDLWQSMWSELASGLHTPSRGHEL